MPHNQPRLPRTEQPAYAVIRATGRSLSKIADEAGVPYLHLRQACRGLARPSQRVRERLPVVLGLPIEELFEPASLVPPLASATCTCDTCTLKRIKRERALLTGAQR